MWDQDKLLRKLLWPKLLVSKRVLKLVVFGLFSEHSPSPYIDDRGWVPVKLV